MVMDTTSALSLCSHSNILLRPGRAVFHTSSCSPRLMFLVSRKISRLKGFLVIADSTGARGRPASSRKAYKQSQAQAPLSSVPVKEIAASFILPAAAFVLATFVLWKLVEKLLLPKQVETPSSQEKPSAQGMKWSIAPGPNLLSGFGAKIERESKQKLNEFAQELRTFRSVDMSVRNFGDEGLFFLAESLAYNQTAEEVNFTANGITEAGIKAFDGVLQSNIVLKTLNLSGNPIGDEGAKCLSEILKNNSGIQMLQLNSTGIGDEGAKAISEMLKINSSLRILELNNNMIDFSGFQSIAAALLENNTLQSLSLTGNYGGPLGASALEKGLEGNKSLRVLNLNGNSIGDEGVRTLMSGLFERKGRIQHLDIANNSISVKGAHHIAEYVKRSKNLLLLNLYMNDIGDEMSSIHLMENVGESTKCIEDIIKNYNSTNPLGAEKMAEALKENRSVTNLDLGGNNIHTRGALAIAQVLKDNNIITNLEFGYNPIGPEGAKAFADVLKFHGSIKILSLGWCQIGVKGAEYIADTLKYNSTISTLDLRANGLRDEGAMCLAQSLKVVNEVLTSLDLAFNEIRDEGAFAVSQALKANEEIRLTSLNLSSNLLTRLGQTALTDARDHVFEMTEKEIAINF